MFSDVRPVQKLACEMLSRNKGKRNGEESGAQWELMVLLLNTFSMGLD